MTTTSNPFAALPVLEGQLLRLRPLVARDQEAVYTAASDPLIWAQHPEPERWRREVFLPGFFAGALTSGSAYTIETLADNAVVGSSRYYDWDADKQEVAIGYTFLTRSLWGGQVNRELKTLMLGLAFEHAVRVWLHIGKDNLRSRKAAEKIGARFSHLTDDARRGNAMQTAWYFIDRPDPSAA